MTLRDKIFSGCGLTMPIFAEQIFEERRKKDAYNQPACTSRQNKQREEVNCTGSELGNELPEESCYGC